MQVYEKNVPVAVAYRASSCRSGLTDVKMWSWDPSLSPFESGVVMPEIGTTGIYSRQFTPPDDGIWVVRCTSDTVPGPSTRTYRVGREKVDRFFFQAECTSVGLTLPYSIYDSSGVLVDSGVMGELGFGIYYQDLNLPNGQYIIRVDNSSGEIVLDTPGTGGKSTPYPMPYIRVVPSREKEDTISVSAWLEKRPDRDIIVSAKPLWRGRKK